MALCRKLAGGLSGAFDQVFDDDGNLLVTGGFTRDFSSGTVITIAPDGTVDELARGFAFTTGVDFSTSTQAVYVLDSGATEITVLCRDADGDSNCDTADTSSGERKCDDGDPCTGIEACVGDICVYGTPPVCDDGDPCTVDSCSAGVGCVTQTIGGVEGLACIFDGRPEATACNGEPVPDRRREAGEPRAAPPRSGGAREPCRRRRSDWSRRRRVVSSALAASPRRAASRSQNPISAACANELEVTIEGARQAALATVMPASQAEQRSTRCHHYE